MSDDQRAEQLGCNCTQNRPDLHGQYPKCRLYVAPDPGADKHRTTWCSCHGFCCVPLCLAPPPHHEGRGGPWASREGQSEPTLSSQPQPVSQQPIGPE